MSLATALTVRTRRDVLVVPIRSSGGQVRPARATHGLCLHPLLILRAKVSVNPQASHVSLQSNSNRHMRQAHNPGAKASCSLATASMLHSQHLAIILPEPQKSVSELL